MIINYIVYIYDYIYIYPKEQLQKMVTINPYKTLLRSAILIKVFGSAKDEYVSTYYIYMYICIHIGARHTYNI